MNRPDFCCSSANLLDRLATLCTNWFSWVFAIPVGWRTSRAVRLWLLPVLVLSILGASCQGPIPIPPPRPGSWLVFLCRASDAPQEPHDVAYYQELFDQNQADLLFDYFQRTSNNTVDLSGTEVYGWFQMGVNTAQIAPAVRNNTTNPNRTQTAQDCKSAGAAALLATGRSINPDNYAGFIAVINVPVDAGQAGQSIVANEYESASFYAHEMLHFFGLDHSNVMANDLSQDHSWNLGADRVYGDCWDIMSYATCTFMFNTLNHANQGPELQMAYREKLGWLDPARIFFKGGTDPSQSTITLAPVSEPAQSGFLLAKVEMISIGMYVIEYRVPSGFDRDIPNSAVVIRELRDDGKTYLVTRQNGNIGWAQGEQFTDAGNFLSITVDTITSNSATITINPRFSSGANLGDICGNKYVGEVRSCPPGAVCDARRNPPLVTIDYFCQ